MNRVELLASATDAVNRRPKAYGPPEQNFNRIAARWRVHLKNRFDMDVPVDAVSVAAMCADLKLARIEETPDHEDSWVDLAGYAACGAEVATAADAAPVAAKQIKVGARVRFVWNNPALCHPLPVGKEGVVLQKDAGIDCLLLVRFDTPTLDSGDSHRVDWWCHSDELELI